MNTKKLGIRQKEMYYFCLRNHHTKHEINNNVLNVAKSLVKRNLLTLTYCGIRQTTGKKVFDIGLQSHIYNVRGKNDY